MAAPAVCRVVARVGWQQVVAERRLVLRNGRRRKRMLARQTKNAKIAIPGAGPGNATHGRTLKHMTLFQNEVMPAFKKYHEQKTKEPLS